MFERTLERGLEDRWEDFVLAQYLDGELDREESIEHVGRRNIARAERRRLGPERVTLAAVSEAGPLVHLSELDRDGATSLKRALLRETSLFVAYAVRERGIRTLGER